MGRRLASSEATRQRITAATFELHATIGPSRTTVRGIADRAGVQRHTVYAHFPDLAMLYLACTEHGIRVTGMPVPDAWLFIADPLVRLNTGLQDLFDWYRANESMLRNVLYDVDPSAPPPTEPDLFERRMASIHEALAAGWAVPDGTVSRTLNAVVGHATAFETWRSLTANGLTDTQAVAFLENIVAAVADGTLAPVRTAS